MGRGAGRDTARFEAAGGLDDSWPPPDTCSRSAVPCGWSFPPERLDELLAGLTRAGLAAKRLRLVHPRPDEPARILLAEAVAHGRPGLTVEPPLVLHEGSGPDTRFTARPWTSVHGWPAIHEKGRPGYPKRPLIHNGMASAFH